MDRTCIRTIAYTSTVITFCRPFNEAASRKRGMSTIVCAPDQRHNSNVGSIHQKSWVVKRGGETVAYAGSMDVSAGRYDTRKHDQDATGRSSRRSRRATTGGPAACCASRGSR